MSNTLRRTLVPAALLIVGAAAMAGANAPSPNYSVTTTPFQLNGPAQQVVPHKRADTLIYDNTENFSGFGINQGGTATVGTTQISSLVADDIEPTQVGVSVDSFSFTYANFDAGTVVTAPYIRFYDSDPNTGEPTTLLAGFNLNPVMLTTGAAGFLTLSGSNLFTVPTDGLFWAGVAWTDDNGAGGVTGASAANLDNQGQLIFDPPTVGTSQDVFFQTGSPTDAFTSDNPSGNFFNFGGSPVGNFGWQFTTPASTVPEFDTAYLLMSGAGMVAFRIRMRRKPATPAAE